MTATLEHPLPTALTPLIGRTRELAALQELLGSTRLLTLTGAGGSGKTRLALEVASCCAASFADGAAWVELAAISDPALVCDQVARALGIAETAGDPTTEVLRHALAHRSLLLVLDNCEHLVDACATLVETLLRGAPGLKVLATSREALGVPGEVAWMVPPLALPDTAHAWSAEALSGFEAVQLFVERARAAQPSFDLTERNAAAVAQICHRLDGMPLAIELAAARVRVLSPEQIAERLGDAFRLLTGGSRTALPRHRTLRATIDWSYELLSAPEQLLLQRLSVFAGGCTLEAAEAIGAGGGIEAFEVLDLIASLVDRSLVVVRETPAGVRYRLLETLRQYAMERLQAAGETAALEARHATYFLELAEAAEEPLERVDSAEWISRIAAEHDNFRAALERTRSTSGGAEVALRMVGALSWFWLRGVQWREGLYWLEDALTRYTGDRTTREYARALQGAGALAHLIGELPRAVAYLVDAASLWRSLGELHHQSRTLCMLSQARCNVGELERALEDAHESVRLARQAGDPWTLALNLGNGPGFVHLYRGEYDLAERYFAESEALWREIGHSWGIIHGLASRACSAWLREDLEAAARYGRSWATLGREMVPWRTARALIVFAAVAAALGDFARAARLLGAFEACRNETRARLMPVEQPHYDRLLHRVRTALDSAAFQRAWAEGEAMTHAAALDYAVGEIAPAEAPQPAPPPEPPAALPAAAREAGLRVLALGPLQIYRRGELLPPEAWGSVKPRELLLFLLCHPHGCTKEQVGLALWPDASPTQLRNNFHTTLHRLRRALGEGEWVSLTGDRYRIAPELGYEFDAALFEHDAAAALREHRAGGDAAQRLRAALALYRGDLLEGEVVGDWHLEDRDRLRQLYVAGMLALGESRFGAGDYAEAAAAYRHVILREELSEEAYRRLMLCHARLGERAQALRLYQRLAELLRAEVDTEPEEDTAALFEQLQRGEVP